MRIFRLVYEEIDTEDKENKETNIKLVKEQEISKEALKTYIHPEDIIRKIQQNLFLDIINSIKIDLD